MSENEKPSEVERSEEDCAVFLRGNCMVTKCRNCPIFVPQEEGTGTLPAPPEPKPSEVKQGVEVVIGDRELIGKALDIFKENRNTRESTIDWLLVRETAAREGERDEIIRTIDFVRFTENTNSLDTLTNRIKREILAIRNGGKNGR